MIRKTKLKLRREAPSWVGPELPPELRLDGSRRKHMGGGKMRGASGPLEV